MKHSIPIIPMVEKSSDTNGYYTTDALNHNDFVKKLY